MELNYVTVVLIRIGIKNPSTSKGDDSLRYFYDGYTNWKIPLSMVKGLKVDGIEPLRLSSVVHWILRDAAFSCLFVRFGEYGMLILMCIA